MKKVLLIDSNNILKRAYHGAKGLNVEFFKVGGIYHFFSIVGKILKKTNPDKIMFLWDGEDAGYYRYLIDNNYKANRKGKSWTTSLIKDENYIYEKETITFQKNKVIEYLKLFDYPSIEIEKIEADDIISQITKDKNHEFIIASADNDLYQLIDKNVSVYDINDRKESIIGINNSKEKFSFNPKLIAVIKAITGDKSDNIKGVGVMFLTLIKFLNNYNLNHIDSFESFWTEIEKINDKVSNKIKSKKDLIEKNLKLISLSQNFLSDEQIKNINQKVYYNNFFSKFETVQTEMINDGVASCIWKKDFHPDFNGYFKPFFELTQKSKYDTSNKLNVVVRKYHKSSSNDYSITINNVLYNDLNDDDYKTWLNNKIVEKESLIIKELNLLYTKGKQDFVNIVVPSSFLNKGNYIKKIIEEKINERNKIR